MEAFLARAARERPAALARKNESRLWRRQRLLKGLAYWVSKKNHPHPPPRATEGWNLYTKLPLALTGLELDWRLTAVLQLLLPSKPERLLGLVA